jgi:hypothetical protein
MSVGDDSREIIEHHTEHKETVVEREPIHPWRWRALAVWIVVFSLIVVWAVAKTRSNVHAINQSRVEVALENCRSQNLRHDNTIRELNVLISELPKDRQARAQASKPFTILLIDALAPKRNCATVIPEQINHR